MHSYLKMECWNLDEVKNYNILNSMNSDSPQTVRS